VSARKAAAATKSTAAKAAAAKKAAIRDQVVGSNAIRELTDAVTIRAIAHPVRMALLEALTREGPLTATQAADIVDESPANCSFHFRTLAKYGFVEEVPGTTGRARPWRRATIGQSVEALGTGGEISVAAQTLADMAQTRAFDKLRQFIATAASFPSKWQRASFSMDWLVYVTPEELKTMNDEITEIYAKYRYRIANKSQRPPDARAVQVVAYGFPLPPTQSGN
jgi:predicted transcriptional regulator